MNPVEWLSEALAAWCWWIEEENDKGRDPEGKEGKR